MQDGLLMWLELLGFSAPEGDHTFSSVLKFKLNFHVKELYCQWLFEGEKFVLLCSSHLFKWENLASSWLQLDLMKEKNIMPIWQDWAKAQLNQMSVGETIISGDVNQNGAGRGKRKTRVALVA